MALPTTTGLTPTSAPAGSPPSTLIVHGTKFVATSVVYWRGSARPTTFVRATRLTAEISASDLSTAGTAPVTVRSPSPGGGTSNAQTFTVNKPKPSTVPERLFRPSGVCGDVYGSLSNQRAIETAMYSGTEADVIAAIDAAKATRGNRVGCAEAAYTYKPADFTEPTLDNIASTWKTVHAPRIATYTIGCPLQARTFAAAALGGYYARLAGFSVLGSALAAIGEMQESTQYFTETASATTVPFGVFGYLRTKPTDPCYLARSEAIEKLCATDPGACVQYTGGLFAGREFNIADIVAAQGVFEGFIAYDHGIAGVMMIEAGLVSQPLQARFRASALRAGDWAVAEPPVRNHNYTAKLVWLLAGVYAWTGDPVYGTALLAKLARGLKPGLLTNFDDEGLVDGMSVPVRFEELAPVARTPGRMWDGHNALPWYQGMNAWAFVEAYVALRDRGNAAAAAVKPYASLSLNNLAHEINTYGTLVPTTTSEWQQSQVLYALLLGLYKIAAYENEPHPDWETAAAALWNAGTGQNFPDMPTVTTGLYLLYKSEVPWVPLSQRTSS